MAARGTAGIDFVMPPITNIRRYRYRPGDRIIVRINQRLSQYDGNRVRQIIADALSIPNAEYVLILDGGADVKVLRNTQETSEKRDA